MSNENAFKTFQRKRANTGVHVACTLVFWSLMLREKGNSLSSACDRLVLAFLSALACESEVCVFVLHSELCICINWAGFPPASDPHSCQNTQFYFWTCLSWGEIKAWHQKQGYCAFFNKKTSTCHIFLTHLSPSRAPHKVCMLNKGKGKSAEDDSHVWKLTH